MPGVDRIATAKGTAAGLLVAAPALLLSSLAAADEPASWVVLTYLAAMALAFAAAGAVAGWERPDTPMWHGAIAAAITFIVIELVSLPQVAAGDGEIVWLAVLFIGLVATSEGVVAGLAAEWLQRRLRRTETRAGDQL